MDINVKAFASLSARVSTHNKAWIPKRLRSHEAIQRLIGKSIQHIPTQRGKETAYLIWEGTSEKARKRPGRKYLMTKRLRITIPPWIASTGDYLYFFIEDNKIYYLVCK